MSRKTWNTVGKSARIEYEVKKSVFIADVAPVSTGEEATDFLRKIKKEFPDARHHVYAYRAGDETLEQRYSDDGEPSGTAGMPVLDVLLHKELDDVICVVTRYFGEATPVVPVYCPKEEKEKLVALVNDVTAGRGKITHIGSSATRIEEK